MRATQRWASCALKPLMFTHRMAASALAGRTAGRLAGGCRCALQTSQRAWAPRSALEARSNLDADSPVLVSSASGIPPRQLTFPPRLPSALRQPRPRGTPFAGQATVRACSVLSAACCRSAIARDRIAARKKRPHRHHRHHRHTLARDRPVASHSATLPTNGPSPGLGDSAGRFRTLAGCTSASSSTKRRPGRHWHRQRQLHLTYLSISPAM